MKKNPICAETLQTDQIDGAEFKFLDPETRFEGNKRHRFWRLIFNFGMKIDFRFCQNTILDEIFVSKRHLRSFLHQIRCFFMFFLQPVFRLGEEDNLLLLLFGHLEITSSRVPEIFDADLSLCHSIQRILLCTLTFEIVK